MIRIGTAGTPTKDTLSGVRFVKEKRLSALEVEFVRGVHMSISLAKEIGEEAKKLGVELSVHAPYYINLNSAEKKKVKESEKRILDSAERAHYLKAKAVVFHPGYYGKFSKEETYRNVKESILRMQKVIKKNKWKTKLAPETTGKVNVFGSLEEILKLSRETKCGFCVDFAHLKARNYGKIDYKGVVKKLPKKHLHVHFSGIEYSSKGERRHLITKEKDIKELLKALKGRDCTIINESPDPLGDSLKTKKILEEL